MVLDENIETFVIYIISINFSLILIYLIKKAKIAFLIIKKINILAKNWLLAMFFLKKETLMLLKIIIKN